MERYANKQNLVQLAKAVHDKYSATATTSSAGLMSAEDKAKLDRIQRDGIAALTAKGHAEQASTTGKNLLPRGTTNTVNNVPFVIGSDGSIQASGTASAAGNFFFAVIGSNPITLAAGTYTVSLSSSISGGRFRLYDGSTLYANISSGTSTFTLGTQTDLSAFINFDSGAVSFNGTIQLELGSTATEYEPYTGGAPSPSPDYPQEIQVVKGRNLIDAANAEIINGYFATNGSFRIGTLGKILLVEVKPNTTYAVHGISNATNITWIVQFANKPVENDTACTANVPGQLASNFDTVFTTDGATGLLAIRYGNSGLMGDDEMAERLNALQLTLGSTPQPYVPYGHVGMEVHSVKNLFRGNNRTLPTPIPAGTKLTASSDDATTLYLYDQDGTQNDYWSLSQTAENGRRYRTFTLAHAAYSMASSGRNVQVELGNTLTDYEPHYLSTTPIPLPQRGWVGSRPDGTADVLTLDGAGKVTWNCNLFAEVYDGTDMSKWTINSSDHNFAIRTDLSVETVVVLDTNSLCSCAKRVPIGTGNVSIGYSNNTQTLRFRPFDGVTLTTLTEFFQTTPTTFLLPLATPVTEECGYVDMPTISGECQVSIPELDVLGVTYLIGDSVREMAEQWYERARSEYEDRITSLEAAVSEIIAG